MLTWITTILARGGLSVGIRAVFVGIVAAALLGILGLIYWHYSSLLEDVSGLRLEKAKLETTVGAQDRTIAAQQQAIDEWKDHTEQLVRQMAELQEVSRSAGDETRRLHELFARHDLEAIGRRRPSLLEDRINAGSDRARCLLERATAGASAADC